MYLVSKMQERGTFIIYNLRADSTITVEKRGNLKKCTNYVSQNAFLVDSSISLNCFYHDTLSCKGKCVSFHNYENTNSLMNCAYLQYCQSCLKEYF